MNPGLAAFSGLPQQFLRERLHFKKGARTGNVTITPDESGVSILLNYKAK